MLFSSDPGLILQEQVPEDALMDAVVNQDHKNIY
jgi:hypothetical protein